MKHSFIIGVLFLLTLTSVSVTAAAKPDRSRKIGPAKVREILSQINSNRLATISAKLKTRRINVTAASSSAQLKRRAVMGVIAEIKGNILTLTHQIKTGSKYTVILTPDTIIKSKSATSSASLIVGLRIAVVGDPGVEGITARLIHIIPGLATGIFNRQPIATPSAFPSVIPTASPTATPSATPSLTPTPAI